MGNGVQYRRELDRQTTRIAELEQSRHLWIAECARLEQIARQSLEAQIDRIAAHLLFKDRFLSWENARPENKEEYRGHARSLVDAIVRKES